MRTQWRLTAPKPRAVPAVPFPDKADGAGHQLTTAEDDVRVGRDKDKDNLVEEDLQSG